MKSKTIDCENSQIGSANFAKPFERTTHCPLPPNYELNVVNSTNLASTRKKCMMKKCSIEQKTTPHMTISEKSNSNLRSNSGISTNISNKNESKRNIEKNFIKEITEK